MTLEFYLYSFFTFIGGKGACAGTSALILLHGPVYAPQRARKLVACRYCGRQIQIVDRAGFKAARSDASPGLQIGPRQPLSYRYYRVRCAAFCMQPSLERRSSSRTP